ncbi:MAG: RyR domain-containing protein [Clostridia bacterium]
MEYVPEPVDTSDVVLQGELLDLVEELARNTHENWSRRKMEEGWTYGRKRDDRKKHSPLLVPFAELPESEKDYDRILSLHVLKLLRKLGYAITKEQNGG